MEPRHQRLGSFSPTIQLAQRSEEAEVAALRSELMGIAQRREQEEFRDEVLRLIDNYDTRFLDLIQALHFVVWTNDNNDLAQRLLDLGCNPFHPDFNGDTVLHYAVRGGNLRVITYLHDKLGPEALNVLNVHHCNLLLTAAAETPDEKANEILYLLEWLWFKGFSLEAQDNQGKTALFWAAQRSSMTVCQWLLSRGANLAHRDHMNRTALHMACSSGNSDVVLFLCQKGAINLLDCESNDDPRINTPIRLCWQRGHLWLSMSLRRWKLWYTVTGQCTFLSNQYAWNALFLTFWNLICGTLLYLKLVSLGSERAQPVGLAFFISLGCVLFFWMLSAKSDPGYNVPQDRVIPCQAAQCSRDGQTDIKNLDKVIPRHKGTQSSILELRKIEVDSARIGYSLAQLNKTYRQPNKYSRGNTPQIESQFDHHATKLYKLTDQMNELRGQVGKERVAIAPGQYAEAVLTGSGAARKVCFTCHQIRPFRSHHCSDCAACVDRFDHHCVWVDNCVGLTNQRSFIFFLISMVAAIVCWFTIFGIYLLDAALLESDANGEIDFTARNLVKLLTSGLFYASVLNSFGNGVWLCFVGFLLGRTTKSMMTDLTFYESLKPGAHVQKRFANKTRGFLWDLQDLTCSSCLKNSGNFCIQSKSRDYVTYPFAERAPENRPLKSRGRASPPNRQPLVNTTPDVTPSNVDETLAWRWATHGPLGSKPSPNNSHPLGQSNPSIFLDMPPMFS